MSNFDTRQARETRKVELVETYNLSQSLNRLENKPNWSNQRWKRSLYHALSMSEVANPAILEKIGDYPLATRNGM